MTFASIYFKDIDSFENFNKTNLLLHWETKESHSIFNKTSFKRVDGLGKGSHLGNTSPNIFLTFLQKQCLKDYPIDTKFAFYRHYFQYILFYSNYLNTYSNSGNTLTQSISICHYGKLGFEFNVHKHPPKEIIDICVNITF